MRNHAAEDAKKEAAEAALARGEAVPPPTEPVEMVGHLMDDEDEDEQGMEDDPEEGSEVVLPDGGVVTVVGSGHEGV